MKNATLLFFLFIASSCVVHPPFQNNKEKADWHIGKAIMHYPEYGDTSYTTLIDSIIIPPLMITDTLIISSVDTVERVKNKVSYRLIRSFDTVEVSIDCPTDTIVLERELKSPPVIVHNEEAFPNRWYLFVLLGLAIGLIFIYLIKRI